MLSLSRRRRLCVLTLAFVLAATSAQAQYRMSGELTILAGRTTLRNITGSATSIPNTNNGATLMIPAGAFATAGTRFLVFPSIPNVSQVYSSFTSSNVAETLRVGGGPPPFQWGPRENFGNTRCSNPGGDQTCWITQKML